MADVFTLNPSLDLERLSAEFARWKRLEIRDFIPADQTLALREHLVGRDDWLLVLNAGPKVYEMKRGALAELTQQQRAQLDRSVADAGRGGFQYRYETIRVSDDQGARLRAASLLDQFVAFMSSRAVTDALATITGQRDIAFADGQATSYSSGHFLTRHDDDVEGKNRRAAYVLGLSPAWRAEWGGLLMFHGNDGNIEEAFTPAMGALRIFAVPALHSVSYVTPLAPEPRLSITGWLRSSAP